MTWGENESDRYLKITPHDMEKDVDGDCNVNPFLLLFTYYIRYK